jgi:hypothetical protein
MVSSIEVEKVVRPRIAFNMRFGLGGGRLGTLAPSIELANP